MSETPRDDAPTWTTGEQGETPEAVRSAYRLLREAVFTYRGEPVGVVAADHPEVPAENYRECFVRDFVPSAMVFLLDGETEIVRRFLETVLDLHDRQRTPEGHQLVPGVMPASFRVVRDVDGDEHVEGDFGDRAIGRVAPVDSLMWWIALLARYTETTGDLELAHRPAVQGFLRNALRLMLREAFEVYPTLLTPDACCMIDRRMGVYGHPLEIQSLFFGVLRVAPFLLAETDENRALIDLAKERERLLRDYVRRFYWLDVERLNEIHRFGQEQYGHDAVNIHNISPESIPDWVADWLPDGAGYLLGNVGPGRLDFRFFALGNLLAVATDLVGDDASRRILSLYESRWDDLVGRMPVKICFPAAEGKEWRFLTGSDFKNVAWSYHNGGNWPCLLWFLVGAALRYDRADLAKRAFDLAAERVASDHWPEYYDGRRGRLLGRRASLGQVWSASSLIVAHKLLTDPTRRARLFSPEDTLA